MREASPGFDGRVDVVRGMQTGPMKLNYVALVQKGRAGSDGRVLDQYPEESNEVTSEDIARIQEVLTAALDRFEPRPSASTTRRNSTTRWSIRDFVPLGPPLAKHLNGLVG